MEMITYNSRVEPSTPGRTSFPSETTRVFRFSHTNTIFGRQAGTLCFDYVSTARRQMAPMPSSERGGAMSTRRLQHMLQVLELGDQVDWAAMEEQDFAALVDEVLREVGTADFDLF